MKEIKIRNGKLEDIEKIKEIREELGVKEKI